MGAVDFYHDGWHHKFEIDKTEWGLLVHVKIELSCLVVLDHSNTEKYGRDNS